jgi:nucleoside-diphosphate-sugar epimerase
VKRAFVTGATGFIGSYLVRELLRQNYEVAILARPESDLWRIEDVQREVRQVIWDGVAVDSFAESFREFAPLTVFHLGWSGVGNVHRNQLSQLTENINFSVALTQLSVECGVQQFVGAGSQAEYGPVNSIVDEHVLPRPTTLYGAAKLSVGILTERIASLGGMQHAWLRIFSTYGPKDNPQWMLPSLISCLQRGERPALTLGEQLWDFLHVEDAARAFVSVAESGVSGVFNLGSGEANPLRTVIEMVRDFINPGLPLGFGEVPYRPDQVMCLQADVTRLRHLTGWFPQVVLAVGLKELATQTTP